MSITAAFCPRALRSEGPLDPESAGCELKSPTLTATVRAQPWLLSERNLTVRLKSWWSWLPRSRLARHAL